MAKLGEGDPRWIVKDLGTEGSNVGGWHWVDQDVLEWCKERIPKFVEGKTLLDLPQCLVKLTKVSHVKGDATVLSRKRRLFAVYELDVCVKWIAQLKNDKGENISKVRGTIRAPCLESEESDLSSFEVQVTVDDKDEQNIKLIVHKQGIAPFKDLIIQFLKELRDGANLKSRHAQMLADTAQNGSSPTTPTSANTENSYNIPSKSVPEKQKQTKSSSGTDSIELVDKFSTVPAELMECFLDEKRVSAYTQSPAKIERKVGGKFTMFNGMIHGEMIELEPGKKIKQKWRFADWDDNVYSTLTMEFNNRQGETELRLKQTNLPKTDKHGNEVKQRVVRGWQDNFFRRIKGVFGFGTVSFF